MFTGVYVFRAQFLTGRFLGLTFPASRYDDNTTLVFSAVAPRYTWLVYRGVRYHHVHDLNK